VAGEQFIKSLESPYSFSLVTHLIWEIVYHVRGSDDSEEIIYQKDAIIKEYTCKESFLIL